jgi:hypothetical protein
VPDDLAAAADVSGWPDPFERLMTAWLLFGSEEGGGGAEAASGTGGSPGGEAADAVAIGATAADPRALGGGVPGLGGIGTVFGGS